MTWTYTPDFTTTRDQIRFQVGDTDSTDPLITDEEIAHAATQATGIYNIAALVAEAIAAKFARRVDMQVDSARKSASQMHQHYLTLAGALRKKALTVTGVAPYLGGQTLSDKESRASDTDRTPPAFTRNLFKEPGTAPENDSGEDGD